MDEADSGTSEGVGSCDSETVTTTEESDTIAVVDGEKRGVASFDKELSPKVLSTSNSTEVLDDKIWDGVGSCGSESEINSELVEESNCTAVVDTRV